mgnify:CR=1 FL=1
MATFREIQANFRANAQSLKRTLRGIKSEMGSMKSETEKVSQSSQKAYGRMADGTKVYRNAQGQLQTELGKTVTASQVAAREGGRTEQVWHNISSGLDTASRGVQSFSTRLQGIGGGLVSFGSTLTRNVTMPLVGLATALGGTALVKGFNRLVGIDTAQAKLKALGHDGEAVEGIMNSANESVLGTSFGLDEAATIAASAVAAGVETGSELTKYLTTTGDAAAIAGTSLDEMGSIFNKVQTSGKAYNSELQMLSERGLPIYTWLAEEANTTEDAIFDMASQGKVSTEMFLSAVENNIGGAAAVMGEESFTAALANMWAAVGRLGASFLEGGEKGEGFFHQMKPIFEELTEGFDNMGDVAAVWGEKFGAAFATFIDWIRQTIDWFRKKESWFQALVVAFGVFMSAIGPILLILGKLIMGIASVGSSIGIVLGWFSKLTLSISSAGGLISWLGIGIRALAGRFSFLLGPIGIVIGVITTLASVFMYAYRNSESFRNFINGLGDMFVNAYEAVKEFIANTIAKFKEWYTHLTSGSVTWQTVLSSLGFSDELIERIEDIIENIRTSFSNMRERIGNVLNQIGEVFSNVWNGVKNWWAENGQSIIGPIVNAFNTARDWIGIALDAVGQFFSNVFSGIRSWWNENGESIISGVVTAFEWMSETIGLVMDFIGAYVEFGWNNLKRIFEIGAPIISHIWDVLWNGIRTVIDIVWPIIQNVARFGIDFITSLFQTFAPIVSGIWNTLWTGIRFLLGTVWDGIKGIVKTGADFIQTAIRIATAIIEGNWSTVWQEIRGFTNRTFETIKQLFSNLRERAVEIIGNLVDRVKTWFFDMYENLRERVQNIRDNVTERFNNLRNRVVQTVTNLYERVTGWFRDLYDNLRERVQNIRQNIVDRFTQLRDQVVSRVRNLYERVRDWFRNLYNNLRERVSNIRRNVVDRFTELRDQVINRVRRLYNRVTDFFWNIYTYIRDKMLDAKNAAVDFAIDLYEGAKEQFENLVDGAKDMMNGIGDWITSLKSSVVNKAKDLGIDIANAAINGFNSMIKGINSVANALGYSGNLISTISTIKKGTAGIFGVRRFSKGTNYHMGGNAIVGDKGYGNTVGGGSGTREIVQLPNGKNFLMDGDVFIPNAPKGMKVHSNKNTEAILANNPNINPDLVGGSGVMDSINRKAGELTAKLTYSGAKTYSTIKGIVDNVMDYVDDPMKLATDVLGLYTDFDLPEAPIEIASRGILQLKDTLSKKFKSLFEEFGSGGDGSHILNKRILQRFGRYTGGIGFNGGRHYGVDTAHKFDPLLSPVNGRVTRTWRDYGGGKSLQITTDKHIWWFMHLSNIMKKVGDTVKAGMRVATTGNSGNFVVGSGHLHTQVHPRSKGAGNHNAIDPLPILRSLKGAGASVRNTTAKLGGYFKGGITSGFPELAWLNEEGFRESIISHNPAHRERSHDIWSTTGNALGFGDNKEELALLREEIGLLKQIVKNTGDTADNTDVMKDKEPMGIGEFEKLRNKHLNKRML